MKQLIMSFYIGVLTSACGLSSFAESKPPESSDYAVSEGVKVLHPLVRNPLQKDDDPMLSSLKVGYIAAIEILKSPSEALTQAAPDLNSALHPIDGFVNKGERYWEVQFFRIKDTKLEAIVFVHADSGLPFIYCNGNCREVLQIPE